MTMYLFIRNARLRRTAVREGMAWAVGVTEKVNQITSLNVGLWRSMFSPAVGTISWTSAVKDLTELEDAFAKLAVDDMYVSEIERGAELLHDSTDDALGQFVHIAAENANAKWAAVVQSSVANGSFRKGIESGVEIAMRASALGAPTSFLTATTGTYAGVLWMTGAETLAELERGEQAITGDAGFVEYLDEVASGCYLPGVTTQSIFQRII